MPTITVRGTPFHVALDGDEGAPPLLLSNSLSCDLGMWDDVVPALAMRFRLIRYDARGHGRTPASPPPATIEGLGRDALGLLDALGLARVHVVGLSLGGMTAMWLLTHAPERIGRAVLANTAAHMGPPELWNGRMTFASRGGMEATVEPTLARWFPAAFRAAAPHTMARMAAAIRATSLDGYLGCCAAIRDMDQRETIRTIRAPVLVVVGANDPATTPADGEAIRAAIPGAAAVTLAAAHISAVERPTDFAAAVLGFLEAGSRGRGVNAPSTRPGAVSPG